MQRFAALLMGVLFVLPLPCVGQQDETIIGYSPQASAEQRALEQAVRAAVSPAGSREVLRELTNEINMAGTPGDLRNADYVAQYLRDLGLDVTVYPYYVYLPYPRSVKLTITGDEALTIIPGEAGVPEDPDSERVDLAPFNAFSPSGDVAASVVFANFGRPEDFAELEKQGVEVRGAIIVCRYGRIFRGSKVYEAERRGAAGVILYSDPADDGYVRGDIYPDGPMRPADAIQRGSIYYMFNTPGDPLTPMEPATRDAKRLDPADAGLPAIPCVPLAYGDASKILERLRGPEVPDGWQGGLPFRYHLGSGPVEVRMQVENEFAVREVRDVVGILPGREEPDQWILVGCHRDAWLYGAQDPHGGNAVILEAVRAIVTEAARRDGLRRSIAVCSWDAEEFGVMGSIEWVEQMRDVLDARAVVYMNADAIISGDHFGAAATPTLRPAYQQVLAEVSGPGGGNLLTDWRVSREAAGRPAETYTFGSFGGGSDHTGFLHHVGVPCVSAGFWGPSGVYHSAYDTFNWMQRFGDPEFASHAAAARLMATLLVRIANAEVLPFSPSAYAPFLRENYTDLKKAAGDRLASYDETFMRLFDEIEGLGSAYERELARRLETGELTDNVRKELNGLAMRFERAFVDRKGLPGQPWNRNLLFATSRENGYGMLLFPGMRNNLEDGEAFARETGRLIEALTRFRNEVAGALALILGSEYN